MGSENPKKQRGRPRKQQAPEDEGDGRSSNWTVVCYPESLPEGWESSIEEYHIEWCRSPLHEFDLNATGEDKKPHYHLVLKFGTLKSFDQVKQITDKIHAPIPKRIMNMRSMVRYLCHLDNPDKHQYPLEQIKSYGGFDVDDILKATATERFQIIKDMIQYCEDHDVNEIRTLILHAIHEDKEEWHRCLCDSSERIMSAYLRSKRHTMPKQQQEPIQHCDNDMLAEIKAKLKKPE